jgi:uncharacterized membrane protein YfhO
MNIAPFPPGITPTIGGLGASIDHAQCRETAVHIIALMVAVMYNNDWQDFFIGYPLVVLGLHIKYSEYAKAKQYPTGILTPIKSC